MLRRLTSSLRWMLEPTISEFSQNQIDITIVKEVTARKGTAMPPHAFVPYGSSLCRASLEAQVRSNFNSPTLCLLTSAGLTSGFSRCWTRWPRGMGPLARSTQQRSRPPLHLSCQNKQPDPEDTDNAKPHSGAYNEHACRSALLQSFAAGWRDGARTRGRAGPCRTSRDVTSRARARSCSGRCGGIAAMASATATLGR